jgi:methyltransferase (TIGR00027 family)
VEANKASMTALAASLMRALHTRADPAPIINDPWGDRLVPSYALDALRRRALADSTIGSSVSAVNAPANIVDAYLRTNAAYAIVITRTRYAEDALHAAVARGATQYILIGAGFDSYALRMPSNAQHVAVYEVDHPTTQTLKKSRLQGCGVKLPPQLNFVAADLAAEGLVAGLSKSTFDRSATSFFSWLGVSMYLTREANLRSLRSIAACGGAGSEVVFTYFDQAAFDKKPGSSNGSAARLHQMVASMGEPFISGFYPQRLAQDLAEVGLELLEDLDELELISRYDPHETNGFNPAGQSHIAWARVK